MSRKTGRLRDGQDTTAARVRGEAERGFPPRRDLARARVITADEFTQQMYRQIERPLTEMGARTKGGISTPIFLPRGILPEGTVIAQDPTSLDVWLRRIVTRPVAFHIESSDYLWEIGEAYARHVRKRGEIPPIVAPFPHFSIVVDGPGRLWEPVIGNIDPAFELLRFEGARAEYVVDASDPKMWICVERGDLRVTPWKDGVAAGATVPLGDFIRHSTVEPEIGRWGASYVYEDEPDTVVGGLIAAKVAVAFCWLLTSARVRRERIADPERPASRPERRRTGYVDREHYRTVVQAKPTTERALDAAFDATPRPRREPEFQQRVRGTAYFKPSIGRWVTKRPFRRYKDKPLPPGGFPEYDASGAAYQVSHATSTDAGMPAARGDGRG